MIGASCYLLTTAAQLAASLFLQKSANMCGSAAVSVQELACMNVKCYILYANAHLSVCKAGTGSVDVNIREKRQKLYLV